MVDNIFGISSAVLDGADGLVGAISNGIWAVFNAFTEIFK